MALTVSTLFNFSQTPFKLKLLAGKTGLSKTVSWVYYTEDPTTIEFIRGGELAITTGLNLERRSQNQGISSDEISTAFLKEFVDNFITHNAAGLIVNIGKYIESIPQSIIDYCDEKNFPLFTMPWEVHTVDLMQDLGNMISSDSQNCHNIEKFFYQSIFEKEKFDPLQLENTIFYNAEKFSVAIMELDERKFNSDMEQTRRYIHFTFNSKINISRSQYCCFIHNHKVIYIIRDDNAMFSKELFSVAKGDSFFKTSKMSISDTTTSVLELEDCYNHAQITMELNNNSEKLYHYDDLGIYKILLEVKNRKVLEQFYNDVLGNMEQLESSKREDYIKTLQLYLKLGGNIHSVSEENNTHRNTVLYRLQRLEDILDVDLSDGDTRCMLQIALYIRQLLS